MRTKILVTQVGLVAAFLAVWQFLPQIPHIYTHITFLNPFFISSPSRISVRLFDFFTGQGGYGTIYSYLVPTLVASLGGTAIGLVLGAASGLVLSNFVFVRQVLHPILVALNAIPRIALIPVVVIVLGPTFKATMIVVIMTTFFVAFFNAYEGGRSVSPELINSVTILGAGQWQIIRRVRLPYVMAWTLAALPLAITFALLTAVTSELLIGSHGLGALITQAQVTTDAATTFSVAVVLAACGVFFVLCAGIVQRRILHWWGKGA